MNGTATTHCTRVAILLVLTLLLSSNVGNAGDPPSPSVEQARAILDATGVRGGLVVHLGCGDGALTARAQQDIWIEEVAGVMNLETIYSRSGVINLTSVGSMVDALDLEFTNLEAGTIVLISGDAIGEPGVGGMPNYLDINVTNLNGTLTATAVNNIFLSETEGDFRVRNVLSTMGDVDLDAAVSIVDAVDLVGS